jgi:hypothetical protein
MITQCGGCGKKVWDNRQKKASDPKWANAADFSCRGEGVSGDKGCGWKYNLPAGVPTVSVPPVTPVTAVGNPGSREAEIGALYWRTFDEVLQGVKSRSLVDLLKGDGIAAMAACLFIARGKG